MSKAINAQTIVAYVAETVAGTTPATPTFKQLRCNGETLQVDRKLAVSSELNGRRGQSNYALAQRSGSGGISFEVSALTFEDFIAAAVRDVWTANVVKDQNTPTSFTVEARYEDGATDVFKRLIGAQVDKLSVAFKAASVLSGDVSFMAMDSDWFNAIVAGATYTAVNAEPVQVGGNVAALTMSGLTVDCVPELTLDISNNLRSQVGLGNLALCGVAAGKFEVTGTLSAVLDITELSVLQAHSAGTSTSLSFTAGITTGKKLTFSCPNVILEDVNVQSPSVDGDVMISAKWRALQATSLSGSVIQITRAV